MRRVLVWLLIAGWCTGASLLCFAQKEEQAKKPRAKPKKFTHEETARVFFDDVFQELVGTRPNLQQAEAVADNATSNSAPASTADSGSAPQSGSGNAWSQIISSTAIENEIKAIKLLVDRDVTTPSDFRGRGAEQCRTHFSMAATLFGIINEYDGDVRWKNDAAGARDVFARTASNAKVGTPQVFNEAKLRKVELEDLLSGNGFAGKATEPANDWSAITDRAPLMTRLETGFEETVRPGGASAAEFKSKKETLAHEAEIIAALATVLLQPGMEDADDETYQGFAKNMRTAAREIVDGVKDDNYEKVREAVGTIDQTCTSCHDTYR